MSPRSRRDKIRGRRSPSPSRKLDANSLTRQSNMSSTSLFAELVKSKKYRERIVEKLNSTKEATSNDKGLSETDSGSAVTQKVPSPSAPSGSAASYNVKAPPPHHSENKNVLSSTIANGATITVKPNNRFELENLSSNFDIKQFNLALQANMSSGSRKSMLSLTKLPLPPGINLEDINSPTSPSTPPNDSKPQRLSLTKDLPMPPSEYFAVLIRVLLKLVCVFTVYHMCTGRGRPQIFWRTYPFC